nr:hypothetical protein [Providencia stuartii]
MVISRIKYLLALKRIIIGFTLFSSFSFAETIDVGSVVREGFITPELSISDITTYATVNGNNCAQSMGYGGCNRFLTSLELEGSKYIGYPSRYYGVPLINVESPSSPTTLYLVIVSGSISLNIDGYNKNKVITANEPPSDTFNKYYSNSIFRGVSSTQKASGLKYRIYNSGSAYVKPGLYSISSDNSLTFKSFANAFHPSGAASGWSTIKSTRIIPSFLVRPACTINNPAVVEWKNAAIKPVEGTTYGTKSTTLNYSCETGLNAISVFSKVSSGITDINKKKLFLNNEQTGPYITGSLKNTPPGCSGGDFLFDGETPFVGSNTGSLIMQWDLCSDARPEAGKVYSGAIDVFILAK